MPAQHVPVVPRAPQDMELCKLQREQEGEVPSTILQLLAHRAAQRREAFAYLLLGRDGGELARLSYGELQRRAEAVAAGLAGRVARGDRVLMLFASPLEFLAGLLGVLGLGAVAVPAPPPDASRLKRTRPRLQAILADCSPVCVLVDQATDTLLAQNTSDLAALACVPRFTTETLQAEGGGAFRALAPDDLAYLQYTSGSTAAPRGVMISHRNLLANLAYGKQLWRYVPSSVAVNWMPYFHDYGLVEGLLQPLYSGIPSHHDLPAPSAPVAGDHQPPSRHPQRGAQFRLRPLPAAHCRS
jgi:acyl-CoA synthetase (AMP-forming)/AMP-acid ligase II